MERIGDLMLLLFKKTVFVGWSNERGAELLSFFHTLWDRYNTASDALLQPTLCHRNKMSVSCYKYNRYNPKKERNSLQQLVLKKIFAVSDLVDDLSLFIGICQADEPNPLVVLCVKEAYRKHDEHPKESADILNREEKDLLVQLISARINLSQVTTSNNPGVECIGEKFSRKVRVSMFYV